MEDDTSGFSRTLRCVSEQRLRKFTKLLAMKALHTAKDDRAEPIIAVLLIYVLECIDGTRNDGCCQER